MPSYSTLQFNNFKFKIIRYVPFFLGRIKIFDINSSRVPESSTFSITLTNNNGLASAPRIFTKIMKPVFSTLRKKGQANVSYIDDSLVVSRTKAECVDNIHASSFSISSTL
jgi:hypothetical protein